jgi:hypothetical protein
MTDDVSILEILTDCGHKWAEERAKAALQHYADYEAGIIFEEEFQNFAHELVGTEDLDNEADDLNTKAMLITAVYGLAQVI